MLYLCPEVSQCSDRGLKRPDLVADLVFLRRGHRENLTGSPRCGGGRPKNRKQLRRKRNPSAWAKSGPGSGLVGSRTLDRPIELLEGENHGFIDLTRIG